VDRSFVEVDEWSETGEAGVLPIGDLTGAPCLAHKASHEGITCVEKIFGVVGAEVTELIQGFGIAQNLETTEQKPLQTVSPHPTLSEMMHEATLYAFDRAIHI
jgi:pyruvate/2-oxoglutarate dehydrogenase complex dihydrolipoamide dehydrogenase (E3) component